MQGRRSASSGEQTEDGIAFCRRGVVNGEAAARLEMDNAAVARNERDGVWQQPLVDVLLHRRTECREAFGNEAGFRGIADGQGQVRDGGRRHCRTP